MSRDNSIREGVSSASLPQNIPPEAKTTSKSSDEFGQRTISRGRGLTPPVQLTVKKTSIFTL